MNGIDPYAVMQDIGAALDRAEDAAALNRRPDDLEYLFEALDPQLQSAAEGVMERLRQRNGQVS
jgi:hypothetical protein